MRYKLCLKTEIALALAILFSGSNSFGQRTINTTLNLPTELPTGDYELEVFDTFSTVLGRCKDICVNFFYRCLVICCFL